MKGYTKVVKMAMLAAASAVLAAGCADSRVASKANLADALNHDYSASQDCLFSRPMPFPYQVSVNDKLLAETRHRLDALAEAGLLEREQTTEGADTIRQPDRRGWQILLRAPPDHQRGEVHSAGRLRWQAADQSGIPLCAQESAQLGQEGRSTERLSDGSEVHVGRAGRRGHPDADP
jgi:hypothetical protein